MSWSGGEGREDAGEASSPCGDARCLETGPIGEQLNPPLPVESDRRLPGGQPGARPEAD